MLKVYLKRVKGYKVFSHFLLSQSGDRAKLHSVGEIDIALIRDNDETNKLKEGVLLFIKADAPEDGTVRVMYVDGKTNILPTWKLKASCTEVVKVFETGTTLANDQMYLSK